MDLTKKIPGYKEALEQESTLRDLAFLRIARPVCGITVLPLTPKHVLILSGVRSPFLVGGAPVAADVALYLWICSTEYSEQPGFLRDWRRDRMARRSRKVNWSESVKAIQDHLRDAFMDAPGATGNDSPSYASWVATIVHILASEYGWTEEYILNKPLSALFQYLRCIQKSKDSDATFMNGISDKVRGEWLRQQNTRN